MSELKAYFEALLSEHRKKVLNKHILALVLYRGDDDRSLRDAYREITDPAERNILLVVFLGARIFTEAGYYLQHSALADGDATEEGAKAQIREAHERRELVLGNIVNEMVTTAHNCIEVLLPKAAGGAAYADILAEEVTAILARVAAILEFFAAQSDEVMPGGASDQLRDFHHNV